MQASSADHRAATPGQGDDPSPMEEIPPTEPEFWFTSTGQLWLAHQCKQGDYPYYREYSLPGSIYKIENPECVTVEQLIQCGMCGLRGFIKDGAWIDKPIKQRP